MVGLAGLAVGTTPETPFETAARYTTRRLVAFLRDRYHEVHRRELADAIALAASLPAGLDPGVTAHLRHMLALVETHQRREETAIFPAMLRGGWRALELPLQQMAREHADLERMTEELERLADGFEAPASADVRQRLLFTLCRKIVADLREHARLEDEILFPRFRQFVSAQRRPPEAGLEETHGAVEPRVSHQG